MFKLFILLTGLFGLCIAGNTQAVYISDSSQHVRVEAPQFYIAQVTDETNNKDEIGVVYAPKTSTYVPMLFTHSLDASVTDMLEGNTIAGPGLLPVRITVKKLRITEDSTTLRTKKASFEMLVVFAKKLDGRFVDCYQMGGEITIPAYGAAGAQLYARRISTALTEMTTSFNEKLADKTISKDTITRVAGTIFRQLTPGGGDTISWSAGRHLQPEDYTGAIPDSTENSPYFGAGALSVIYSISSTTDADGFKIVLGTGTCFFKNSSWILPKGRTKKYVLDYEQMKFDLAKINELKFAQHLHTLTFTRENVYAQVLAAHTEYRAQLAAALAALDADCGNSNALVFHKKEVKAWQDKIAAELVALGQQ